MKENSTKGDMPMCGRVALHDDKQFLEEAKKSIKKLEQKLTLKPSYNIAPSQPLATLTNDKVYQYTRFGLIPHWAKDTKFQTINARAETLAEKPTFKSAFTSRRCLIPVNGFYEWKKEGAHKVPYWIHPAKTDFFALAGIYDVWSDPQSNAQIISSAIITTAPNEKMKPIHDRMPVILESKDWALWLDKAVKEHAVVTPLLKPYSSEMMDAYEVSTYVNTPAHNSEQCIKPVKRSLF